MQNGNEFFGIATTQVEIDQRNNSSFTWVVVDPEMVVDGKREIEDGDYLEIYNNMGKVLLSKDIYRDYDSYYNPTHQRQLHQGMAISWAPRGIALDFWLNLFRSGSRARLIKKEK